ncbi:MAG: thioredoxin domain-containing protein, partial [Pyrinomonadaceae bacterium]
VTQTLDKMARGGIYDQLGGGFHRYTVDAIWLVPHFEKMLYDNAQLIRVYLHTYQITGEEFYKRIAVETLEYIRREMLDSSGGFYSTQDADSEGVEGKFFVWTPEEIVGILGEEEGAEFCKYFDVTASGNFEGENIINIKNPVATAPGSDARKKLFEEREKRIKPFRDEKVLTAWNGLMLAAFADAAGVLGNDEYLQVAKENAAFIKQELQNDGRLLRTWKDGKARLNGYIEDYANVTDGLIVLFQVSGEIEYLTESQRLADLMITEFWDGENGGFFFTSNDHEELVVRNKDFYDNATPSGNSVAADVLLRLAKLTGDEKYDRFAVTVLRLAASQIRRHPAGFGRALSALEFHLAETREIVVIGGKGNELDRAVLENYLPNAVVINSENPEADGWTLLKDRTMIDGMATAYVCENFVCQRPVTTVQDLMRLLNH